MTGQTGGLAAVVVTFNRLEQLQRTVARLLESPVVEALVVVDNASNDGTAEWLAGRDDPRLTVITEPVNSGGAGGFARGIEAARDRTTAPWIVLMDDDARPEPGVLQGFFRRDRDTYDGWLAAVRYPSGRICEMNRPWLNPFRSLSAFARTLRRGRAGFHLSDSAYAADDPTKVHGGSFVGLFLSRAAVERGGLPDRRLFLYGDDVLYTLRLTAGGAALAFDPALRFEHDCETLSETGPVPAPLWKTYYLTRNRLMVYRRAAGPILFWPVAALVALRWSRAGRDAGSRRAAWTRLFRAGLVDGLRGRLGRSHAEVLALTGSPAPPRDSGASAEDPAP